MKSDAVARRARRGFTLVETLVVTAIVMIMTIAVTPSFVAWHVRDQVDARAHALLSTFAYARSEALRRGVRVTVCRIDTARRCIASGQACRTGVTDWSCGWAVMIERAGGFYPLRAQPDLASVSIVGTLTNLIFTPPVGQANGSFRSFDIGPRVTSKATRGDEWRRCIRIAAGGRARVVNGPCAVTS